MIYYFLKDLSPLPSLTWVCRSKQKSRVDTMAGISWECALTSTVGLEFKKVKSIRLLCWTVSMVHQNEPVRSGYQFAQSVNSLSEPHWFLWNGCSDPSLTGCGDPNETRSLIAVLFSQSVQLFVTPWTAARQASKSVTLSQSLLKLMSIELMMPSKHLILCHLLLLLPTVFPSIRVFSSESALCIK